MADELEERILGRHRTFLEERIDPDSLLLGLLLSNKTLTRGEIREIRAKDPYDKRNAALLDFIIDKQQCNRLINALKETGQSHLVNYLTADAQYRPEFKDNWPLTEKEISILDVNEIVLVDLIYPDELVGRLYSRGVINKRHREVISSKQTCYEKNEAFLEILSRKSVRDFRSTINCLLESKQNHIAQILDEGGVVVKVHAEGLDDRTEDEIIASMANLLSNKSLEESRHILESTLNVIAMKKGDSVVLYIYCKTLVELIYLKEMQMNRKLKPVIQKLFRQLLNPVLNTEVTIETSQIPVESKFNRLPQHSSIDEVTVTIQENEYEICVFHFLGIVRLRTAYDFSPEKMSHTQKYKVLSERNQVANLKEVTPETCMSNLLFEILDSILRKSYLERVLRKEKVEKNKDYNAINHLASVDYCWFQRIIRRKFKREVWQRLVVYYRRKEKYFSIYRINQQYLEENIRLKGLVNQLKANDYLTDAQAASLYSQNLQLGKNNFIRFKDAMFEVMKKNEAMHSVFGRCLRDTKQHLVSEIIENGGALTKVEIKFQNAETSLNKRHQNLETVEKINEIRDKMIGRSPQIEKLMGKLKQDDMEILSYGQDGDVIAIWTWCQTIYALKKLQNMNKSELIIDFFSELIKNLAFSLVERNPSMIKPNVNIDFEQFEKTVDFPSIITWRLDIRTTENEVKTVWGRRRRTENERVEGVTKLRNKIHVLLHCEYAPRNCVILVFEDQIPFRRLQKRIGIKEIEDPRDIASNEKENALYVLDFSSSGECVWKIKGGGDEKERKKKIIRWLELENRNYSLRASTLSVTRDGKLLFVSWRKNVEEECLWIFGGESKIANLHHTILLPKNIQSPWHAVETSKRNFIIFHEIMRKREEESGSREREQRLTEEEMVVSEVSGDGKTILRSFIPKNEEQKLSSSSGHLAVDSLNRVFLVDFYKDRVILLDSNLQWNRILIPTEEDGKEGRRIRRPHSLFYDEEKRQLIVGGTKEVFVSL